MGIPNLLLYVTTLLCWITSSCLALSAHEQTIGDWNVKIRANRGQLSGERIPRVLFPTDNNNIDKKNNDKNIDCRLSLYSNGTFSLAPSQKSAMPMNGWWELGRNPYCPTDRFYDDLLLESHPRVQKQSTSSEQQQDDDDGGDDGDKHDDLILQRVAFQFKCRIYGRHTRSGSRMNHGVLLWKQTAPKRNHIFDSWRQRRVCASFTAQPMPDDHLRAIGQDACGDDDYDDDDQVLYFDDDDEQQRIAEQSREIQKKDATTRRRSLESQQSGTVGSLI